ncbi:hypothetical protein Ami103574_05225 [Aminipila butyrica]|uniref:EamA domain-containing protein n=1 Tax=Aminipila butyrica TaxID=433296 RepID=A0A858BU92_9FIRM|nr:hypothetical protein [Aminipila butyrica]QIB68759.1 hypothetical protein Ami103574_05225 [Aminipila butyrica]
MFHYYLPVALIVTANLIYQNATKIMPAQINPFLSLTLAYLIAAICSTAVFFLYGPSEPIQSQIRHMNWAPFALGLSIVLLEYGYIALYRSGWNISIGPLVCNIILSLLLILVGLFVYRESITLVKIAGVGLCLAGLLLITKN